MVTGRCEDAEFNAIPSCKQQTPFHEVKGHKTLLPERKSLHCIVCTWWKCNCSHNKCFGLSGKVIHSINYTKFLHGDLSATHSTGMYAKRFWGYHCLMLRGESVHIRYHKLNPVLPGFNTLEVSTVTSPYLANYNMNEMKYVPLS